ncbi:hypothetical protein BGW36DRAFT_367920 [Talaromyces proteolyticus]|uniref:Gag1-like clamp domain-containing protein n=1 Tax=Talaromyces proteolyticus TaxID=1131652 RepID=A0AAD4L5T2_9EURO|nr:uncharacterized protein BGW36DRAFT_367920 [Talaromyces proteolyticus]KAH8705631.1 hypothetical protein BGW36DRAFT_367920 [Talaromyces proteolyticus]
MAADPPSQTSVFASLHRKSKTTTSDTSVQESREAAVRDAKQYVRDVVRNDWAFDPPLTLWSSSASPHRDVVGWRLRDYVSSGSDTDVGPAEAKSHDGEERSAYRFESPDAVRASVVERRRKRRAALEEEMQWNPEELNNLKISEDTEYDCYESDDSIIPVMGTFIPNLDYVRSSITPALYPSIYSKVVLQSLTPTVPINLADVTKAIVTGWKADGQWPPKPSIPVPGSDVPVRKKGHSGGTNNNKTGRRASLSSHGSGVTNAVKKVLGGLSSHSFHLRRSSRSSTTGETMESGSAPRAGTEGAPVMEVPVVEETGGRY